MSGYTTTYHLLSVKMTKEQKSDESMWFGKRWWLRIKSSKWVNWTVQNVIEPFIVGGMIALGSFLMKKMINRLYTQKIKANSK